LKYPGKIKKYRDFSKNAILESSFSKNLWNFLIFGDFSKKTVPKPTFSKNSSFFHFPGIFRKRRFRIVFLKNPDLCIFYRNLPPWQIYAFFTGICHDGRFMQILQESAMMADLCRFYRNLPWWQIYARNVVSKSD
jgi:hypothetical protein